MIRSLATNTFLLFATTLVTGPPLDAGQNIPQPTSNGVDHERRTKFVEYNFEACPQVPTLHCQHGSTCTPGIASFGQKHDHLDLQTQESGYHCACSSGFIGHECEIQVDYCDENPTDPLESCYHGSTCESDGSRFFCDCKKANAESDPLATKFAGAMCQHESTSMCAISLVGSHAPNHQFCTNHGTCVRLVTSGDPHPGCICKDGWTGDHCGIRRDPFTKVLQLQESDSSGMTTLLALLITTTILLAVGTVLFLDARKKKQADVNKGVVFQLPKLHSGGLDSDGSSLPALGRQLCNDPDAVLGGRQQSGDRITSGGKADSDDSELEEYVLETEIV